MKTLTNPTDDQLDAAFAEKVDFYSAKEASSFPDYLLTRNGEVYRKTFKNRNVVRTYNPPRKISTPIKNGYPTANLWKNGKMTTVWLHSLMLKTFVGPRPYGFEAAHQNGIRSDCRIDNLAWKTPRQNYDDMFRHGTNPAGIKNPHARLTDAKVIKMRQWKSDGYKTRQLAAHFKVSRTTVQKICNGQRWPHLLRAHGVEVVFK